MRINDRERHRRRRAIRQAFLNPLREILQHIGQEFQLIGQVRKGRIVQFREFEFQKRQLLMHAF